MIKVNKDCSERLIEELSMKSWPIWSCDRSTFPWSYSEKETCLILEGEVTVTPDAGEPVTFGPGDMVEFSAGLSCTWDVHKAVKKHYKFG
ncbi:MAG: cupin [Blastopirellula sp.]|nr:cupin [Blastopirellula sp.]MAR08848.1 cupin [Blastopirellula sp.]|tara:strand:+ start:219 stop:488 length:270 start_codon:yes stop_codon:yes gene_type:complete